MYIVSVLVLVWALLTYVFYKTMIDNTGAETKCFFGFGKYSSKNKDAGHRVVSYLSW